MHMFALVLVPEGTEDVAQAVANLLQPHYKVYDDATETTVGWWDWYRIGGRWDGEVQGVDRGKECVRCQANDHACHYSNKHSQIKYNVAPVAEVGELKAFTVVVPEGVRHRSTWDGNDFIEDKDWPRTLGTILLAHRDHIAVGVDYHS